LDIDTLVRTFLQEREQGIKTLHSIYLKDNHPLSLRSFKETLLEELKTGCTTFINKNSPMEGLNDYLLYIANATCKKLSKPVFKSKTEYICPACLYLGKEPLPLLFERVFQCYECQTALEETTDAKRLTLFQTFSKHNKKGSHCADCQRFIPLPLDNAKQVSCPYLDCLFVGNFQDLAKMHHPTSKHNPEVLTLDFQQEDLSSWKNNLSSSIPNAHAQLETAETLQNQISSLKSIIETQQNGIPYASIEATIKHKQFIYQAFSNLLDQYPSEMSSYLLGTSGQHNGFQHKVFQEYIRLLEDSFPFIISKHKKPIKIESLLDSSLCLFDGISIFESTITDKLTIKNETKEFYIGGRKASYTKPYYIGKLLNVMDKQTQTSLMSSVVEYSFSKIQMRDIEPETKVVISHLRVPPHYGMGGLAPINRIRKKIVERAKVVVNVAT
jgi:hypothetical protein